MSSVDRFNRTLEDRYSVFKQHLNETVSSFATSNDAARAEHAEMPVRKGQALLLQARRRRSMAYGGPSEAFPIAVVSYARSTAVSAMGRCQVATAIGNDLTK